MRAFRDRVSRLVLILAAVAAALALIAGASAAEQSFFPLAVGNAWIYACSTEGEWQFDRTLSLVSELDVDGRRYFRSELKMSGDSNPLVTYVFADEGGNVYAATQPGSQEATLILPADPKVGDAVSDHVVAAIVRINAPALGDAEAIRIENFSAEDPNIPEERRLEWEGKFYVRGVGLAIEADGLGGECVLSKFNLANP